MSLYIVRGYSVPARALRLRDLRREISESQKIASAGNLFVNVIEDKSPAWLWSVMSSQEALATVWRSHLSNIRKILDRVARGIMGQDYAKELEKIADAARKGDSEAKCKLAIYLSVIADVVAYMFRYPLYRDPLLALVESEASETNVKIEPLLAPHNGLLVARLVLASYVLNKFVGHGCKALKERGKVIIRTIDALMGSEASEAEREIARLISSSLSERFSKHLEALFYSIPADTRPGLNITSLLLHLLMVSAGAATAVYALTGSTGFEEDPCLDAPVVRLAGLLHDIGKPLDPKNHVKASVEEAERLLEGLVPRGVLDAVKELIRSHHGEVSEKLSKALSKELYCLSAEKLHAALRCSDQTFTALDRLSRIVLAVAEGGLDDVEEDVKPLVQAAKEKLLVIGEKLSEKTGLEPLEALRELYTGRHLGVREAFFELLGTRDGAGAVAEATEALAKLFARPRSPKLEEKMKKALGAGHGLPQPCRVLGHRPVFGLAVVDIGGIQKGISESFRLRSMAGFSLLVDYLTMSMVPYAVVLNGSPPEAVVFTGGGTVQAIVPLPPNGEGGERDAASSIRSTIREIISIKPLYELSLSGVKIRVSVKRLEEPLYSETVIEAYRRMADEEPGSASIEAWLATLLSNLADPCKSCGVRPGVVEVGGERYCPICAARYAVTWKLGYRSDLTGYRGTILRALSMMLKFDPQRLLGVYFTKEAENDIEKSFDVLALIAGGHERNYAVIKSDGNVAGMFMSSSITPTMYFERSIRLDMATKNTISQIMVNILNIAKEGKKQFVKSSSDLRESKENIESVKERAERLLVALVYGYMYAGGDDSLLIVPADVALPLAMLLVYGFSAEMGFVVTLSTGVVGAPVKHNIWWSIDAATALLDEIAKSKARPISIKALLNAEPASVAGFIAFDYTDGWGLNSHRALWRHEYLAERGLTVQPLPLLSTSNELGLLELVLYLIGEDVSQASQVSLPRTLREDETLQGTLCKVFKKHIIGAASNDVKDLYKVLAKYVPTKAQELVLSGNAVARSAGFSEILLALSYAASRLDGDQRRGVEGLVKTLVEKLGGGKVPLHDIYLVYKFARGD
jgi:hypothetical protein